jgi:hypothetical protein
MTGTGIAGTGVDGILATVAGKALDAEAFSQDAFSMVRAGVPGAGIGGILATVTGKALDAVAFAMGAGAMP